MKTPTLGSIIARQMRDANSVDVAEADGRKPGSSVRDGGSKYLRVRELKKLHDHGELSKIRETVTNPKYVD